MTKDALAAPPASPLRGREREALQRAYDFLQDKSFMPDALTHECTKVLEQMEAALAATPAVGGEARDANALARHIGECLKHRPALSEVLSLNFTIAEWHELQEAVAERNSERVKNDALAPRTAHLKGNLK